MNSCMHPQAVRAPSLLPSLPVSVCVCVCLCLCVYAYQKPWMRCARPMTRLSQLHPPLIGYPRRSTCSPKAFGVAKGVVCRWSKYVYL
jgi:hypothetical protein